MHFFTLNPIIWQSFVLYKEVDRIMEKYRIKFILICETIFKISLHIFIRTIQRENFSINVTLWRLSVFQKETAQCKQLYIICSILLLIFLNCNGTWLEIFAMSSYVSPLHHSTPVANHCCIQLQKFLPLYKLKYKVKKKKNKYRIKNEICVNVQKTYLCRI